MIAGEQWKADVERESREYLKHHGTRPDYPLVDYLRNYLDNKYPGIYWIVVVYDPVDKQEQHKLSGDDKFVYYLFQHYGQNIVLCQKNPKFLHPKPYNLEQVFLRSYYGYEYPCFFATCYDAHLTHLHTLVNLENNEVHPTMLLVIIDEVFRSVSSTVTVFNREFVLVERMHRGKAYVVLVD